MNNLEQFLALPDVDDLVDEVDVSPRLTEAFGKFKIKAMTQEEFRDYQHKANYKLDKKGVEFDSTKFFIAMVAGQTIEPDFSNVELMKACKCSTPEQVISKKLLMGEIIKLATAIQDISGFNSNINEDVEEAKN